MSHPKPPAGRRARFLSSGRRPPSEFAPLVVRSMADLRALAGAPARPRRLPRNGVAVEIPGVDAESSVWFRRESRRYARACGCSAAGAAFLFGAAAGIGWAGRVALNHDVAASGLIMGATLVATPALAAAAKLLALRLARQRFRRSCEILIRSLSGDPVAGERGRTSDVLSRVGG